VSPRLCRCTVLLAVGALAPGCASALVNATFFHPARQFGPTTLPPGVEETHLVVEDGVRVRAFVHREPDVDRCLVYLHGNGGQAAQRLPAVVRIGAMHTNVVLLEYRGYGRSEGTPTEAGVYRDARAALRFVETTLGIPKSRTVVLGRSLGTAVATEAVQHEPYAGLILISPFTSGRDMAGAIGFSWLAWTLGHPFDTRARLPNVRCPVMVIHGTEDELIPIAQGEEVHAAAPHPDAFHRAEGAHHNGFTEVLGEAYWGWIAEFLDRVAPRTG